MTPELAVRGCKSIASETPLGLVPQWLASYWWAVLLFLGLLGFLANLDGAISFVERFFIKEEAQSEPALGLVELEGSGGYLFDHLLKMDVFAFSLQADVQNIGNVTVYAVQTEGSLDLGGEQCSLTAPLEGQEIPATKIVSMHICPVMLKQRPSERERGRVHLEIRYGVNRSNLNQVMRLKGTFEVSERRNRIEWSPDPDSATFVPRIPASK